MPTYYGTERPVACPFYGLWHFTSVYINSCNLPVPMWHSIPLSVSNDTTFPISMWHFVRLLYPVTKSLSLYVTLIMSVCIKWRKLPVPTWQFIRLSVHNDTIFQCLCDTTYVCLYPMTQTSSFYVILHTSVPIQWQNLHVSRWHFICVFELNDTIFQLLCDTSYVCFRQLTVSASI